MRNPDNPDQRFCPTKRPYEASKLDMKFLLSHNPDRSSDRGAVDRLLSPRRSAAKARGT